MGNISEHIQSADWKAEKHVPVIECPDAVKAGEIFTVKVTLGKEVAHPNTTEHHISWVTVYYHGEGEKFNHQVGHFEFTAHGESTDGPNQGPVYTHHEVSTSMKLAKTGTLHVIAFCNIHGLWQSQKEITVS